MAGKLPCIHNVLEEGKGKGKVGINSISENSVCFHNLNFSLCPTCTDRVHSDPIYCETKYPELDNLRKHSSERPQVHKDSWTPSQNAQVPWRNIRRPKCQHCTGNTEQSGASCKILLFTTAASGHKECGPYPTPQH